MSLDELTLKEGLGPYNDAVTKCTAVQGDQDDFLKCVFDIMATKDPAYAQFYELIKQFEEQGPTALDPATTPTSTPTQPPTPSTALPSGYFQVATDISLISGTTVAADGTVYASLLKPDFSPEPRRC